MELGLPGVHRLFPSLTGFDVKKQHIACLKKMMADEVKAHEKNLVPGLPKASTFVEH